VGKVGKRAHSTPNPEIALVLLLGVEDNTNDRDAGSNPRLHGEKIEQTEHD